jgi:hypothetical protein
MVHLGSAAFPDEREYKAFLAAHGGASNASTGACVRVCVCVCGWVGCGRKQWHRPVCALPPAAVSCMPVHSLAAHACACAGMVHTRYHFKVHAGALPGALLRLGAALSSPLIAADSCAREVENVHAEYRCELRGAADSRCMVRASSCVPALLHRPVQVLQLAPPLPRPRPRAHPCHAAATPTATHASSCSCSAAWGSRPTQGLARAASRPCGRSQWRRVCACRASCSSCGPAATRQAAPPSPWWARRNRSSCCSTWQWRLQACHEQQQTLAAMMWRRQLPQRPQSGHAAQPASGAAAAAAAAACAITRTQLQTLPRSRPCMPRLPRHHQTLGQRMTRAGTLQAAGRLLAFSSSSSGSNRNRCLRQQHHHRHQRQQQQQQHHHQQQLCRATRSTSLTPAAAAGSLFVCARSGCCGSCGWCGTSRLVPPPTAQSSPGTGRHTCWDTRCAGEARACRLPAPPRQQHSRQPLAARHTRPSLTRAPCPGAWQRGAPAQAPRPGAGAVGGHGG